MYVNTVKKMPHVFGAVYQIGMAASKIMRKSPVYYVNAKMGKYLKDYLETENFDAISSLYRLMDGKLEFVEFKVTSDEAYLGKLIKELQVKKGYIIASIIRNRRLIVPRGDDVIEKGDSVLVCTVNKSILRLQDIFAGV